MAVSAPWTCLVFFIGLFSNYLTFAETNTSDEIGSRYLIWDRPHVPQYRTPCFTNGRSGHCVALGACSAIETQKRNIFPQLIYQFLTPFINACSFEGGYCCPDEPVQQKSTEAPWTWATTQKVKPTKKTTTAPTTTQIFTQPVTRPTPTKPPRKTTRRPRPPAEFKIKHKNRKLLPEDSCGVDLASKILGGDETILGEFPWMALIRIKLRQNGAHAFICGGSLISSRYVVSAAHCFVGPDIPIDSDIDLVRLGEHDTKEEKDCYDSGECLPPVQDINIESWKVHENYDPRLAGSYNDIALIRLEHEPKMSLYIAPICLPLDGLGGVNYEGKRLDSAGWGKTSNGNLAKGSNVKLKVTLPFVPMRECASQYLARHIELQDTQICAGGEAGKDTCQGDSGGPLMDFHRVGSEFRWLLVGIVSTGPKDCGTAHNAAVYTKVAKYIRWILDNMRE